MKKPVNIMIDEDLLKSIDEHSEKLGTSRSAFMSMASATYIQQSEVMANLPALMKLYETEMAKQ